MKKQQKYFFNLILILFVLNIFYSCKKASNENIRSTYLNDNKTIYNEIKTLDTISNDSEEPVKNLNINTNNSIVGSWQIDCATPNSGLEIFQNKNNLDGIIAVAPPAIFIEFNLEKGSEADTYYLKYLAQDMSPPLASENEIDETVISKNESIGKIVKNKEGIDLIWYGIYDTKSKKRINVASQFNRTDSPQTVKLVKCNN